MKKTITDIGDKLLFQNFDLKMKLSLLFLFLTIFNLQAKDGYAQKARVTLNIENAKIINIIDAIETTTKFNFIYDIDDVDLNLITNLNVNKERIEFVLEKLFKNSKTTYKIKDTQIILKLKEDKQSFNNTLNTTVLQDFINIKGTISSEQGIPLTGAVISTPDKKHGASSDFDGVYNLKVPKGTEQLIISFIGFETKTILLSEVSNVNNLNIVLKEGVNILEEVVITGYQTISKERSTGSFAAINNEQVKLRPGSTNIIDRIEGLAAGLNYTNGEVLVRGGSSITLNNAPLVVVDGFPITGELTTINPEDVESINILKDASAASIWGVRASNGVIVITTKKGKENQKLKIDVSTFISSTEKIDYSDMKWLNTTNQIDMDLEFLSKGYVNLQQYISAGERLTLLDEAQAYNQGLSPDGDVWSNAQYNNYVNDLRTRDAEKQWEKYLLRSPIQNTYNIALSSGSEKNTTYMSMVFNDTKEASRGNANQRLIFNLNDTYKFSDKIAFNASIVATWLKGLQNGISPGGIQGVSAYDNIVDEFGNKIQYYGTYNKWKSVEREGLTGISHTYNPLDVIQNNDNSTESLDIRAQFGLKIDLLKNITLNTSFQYEKGYAQQDQFQTMENYGQRLRIADQYVNGAYQLPEGTLYNFGKSNSDSWSFRNTLTYDKAWQNHKLTLFAGTEVRKYAGEFTTDRKFGYNKQTTQYIPVNERDILGGTYRNWYGAIYRDTNTTYGAVSPYSLTNYDNREVSAFANGGYEFDKKYSVNGSFRIDQKNLFGSDPKFRYKPLWSAGVAWNISSEDFMTNVDWINRLKLRLTTGVNGNSGQGSPYAQANSRVTPYGSKLYEYLEFINPENQNLKWEETRVTNLGLDFDLFNSKLGGTIEYYTKNSTDLLGIRPIDATNGFTSAQLNYASMTNKGVELTLNINPINGKDFNWKLSGNISYNKNKVTDTYDLNRTPEYIVRLGELVVIPEVGKPLGSMYSFNYAGLDNAGNILMYKADGTTKSWKAGIAGKEELVYNGTTIAPWFGGLTNTFSYKGFDLTVNLTYKFGAVFRREYGSTAFGYGGRFDDIWADRWIKPGDELTTRIPKITYNGTNPYNGQQEGILDAFLGERYWQKSQDFVYSADYIRVRDLILNYNLPSNFTKQTFFNNLQLSFNVTNPFLWVANDKGYDPEAAYSMAYDNLKTYTLGIRATF